MQFPANNAGPDSNGDNDGLFIIIWISYNNAHNHDKKTHIYGL